MTEDDVEIVWCELDLTPAKRCPDYDDECKDVINHYDCFVGGVSYDRFGNRYESPMAEGYCPFLVGSEAV